MGAFISNDRIDWLLKQGSVEEALRQRVRKHDLNGDGVQSFILGEDVGYASLTLGDFLYDYIRIDPEVLRAVEFARAADVDGVLSFARFADRKADLSGASLDGLHSQLQGYVAEQVVAHHLLAEHHDVSFPETATNAGWDLEVDGHQFQVKCLADPGGVYEHLHRYPDIPVIVNAEVGQQIGDHAGVYVDPELHHDAVRHATEEALDRGREVADFEIPWISLGVSGAFNLYYMFRNHTDLRSMLTCTATDTAGRVIGGTTGKYAGATVGVLFFGPAGAIVVGLLGTIGGASAGRRVAGAARHILVADEEAAVRLAAHRLTLAAAAVMPTKINAWKHKSQVIREKVTGAKGNRAKLASFIERRLNDDIQHWNRKQSDLEKINVGEDDPVSLFERVLTQVRRAGVHPHHIQEPIRGLVEAMKAYLDRCRHFRVTHA